MVKKKKPVAEKKNPVAEKKKPAAKKKKAFAENYTKTSSKVGDGATSSTIQLTGSEADSFLKNLGMNLESIRGNGKFNGTVTVKKTKTAVGSTR